MSSKKMGLRRVGIVGLSTLVAASMMTLNAGTAQASWDDSRTTATNAEIGLVDTAPYDATNGTTITATTGTQGATLVNPGVNGQAMGDIRLLLPNSFANGDTIDLTIFDRTAIANNDGQINADIQHKLGFTAAPTVTVNPKPYLDATRIGPNSDTVGNTENTPKVDAVAGMASTPPVFTTSVVESSRALGLAKDIIRLTVAGVQDAGRADDKWIVTLSGLKVDVGTATSPGELRVVPFAYNGTPASNFSNASKMFKGNLADTDGLAGFDPTINIYTVPAYVSPVAFTVGAPNNLVADGTDQLVGDITIAETNEYSLQDGTYTIAFGGTSSPTVRNTTASPITVATTGGADVVTLTAPVVGDTSLTFKITGAANTTKLSITLKGLLLRVANKGTLTYGLTGGSIDGNGDHSFLVTAGSSLEIPATFAGTPGVGGVALDTAFSTGINQTDIDAPTTPNVKAVAIPVANRIGGNDRYETAAKIALDQNSEDQPNIILASGEDFPDALSSGYLANQIGANILLSHKSSLPAVTLDAMRTLGTHTVYVIGGTGAISAGVEATLRATPQWYPGGEVTYGQGKLQVVRLGGADRFATNKIVNQRAAATTGDASPVGRTQITFGQASKLTAFVATGSDFADALSAGPAISGVETSDSIPLILTRPTTLDPNAKSQLNSLGIEQAVILGGTGAVSAGVESTIAGMGVAIHRLGGLNRFETGTMIADFERANPTPSATAKGGLGFDSTRAYLATGVKFADALAGGPLASALGGSPMLLTNPTALSPATATWLNAHSANYTLVVALGLTGAVSNSTLSAANTAIAGG